MDHGHRVPHVERQRVVGAVIHVRRAVAEAAQIVGGRLVVDRPAGVVAVALADERTVGRRARRPHVEHEAGKAREGRVRRRQRAVAVRGVVVERGPRQLRRPHDAAAREPEARRVENRAHWISSGTGVMEKPKSPAVADRAFAVPFQNTGPA